METTEWHVGPGKKKRGASKHAINVGVFRNDQRMSAEKAENKVRRADARLTAFSVVEMRWCQLRWPQAHVTVCWKSCSDYLL